MLDLGMHDACRYALSTSFAEQRDACLLGTGLKKSAHPVDTGSEVALAKHARVGGLSDDCCIVDPRL